jgi:hypothetical protein
MSLAQDWSITGRAVDAIGKPIEGALVELKASGLSGTSLSDGTFALTGPASVGIPVGHRSSRLVDAGGRTLIVRTTRPDEALCCSISDLRGRRPAPKVIALASPGTHRVDIHKLLRPATGQVCVLTVLLGDTRVCFKTVFGEAGHSPAARAATSRSLRKQRTLTDTLQVRKQGYFWARSEVTGPSAAVGDVTLYPVSPQCSDIAPDDGRTYQILYPWAGEVFTVGQSIVFYVCSERAVAKPLVEDLGFDISIDGGRRWGGVPYERSDDGTQFIWSIPDSLFILDAGTFSTVTDQAVFRVSDYDDLNDVTLMEGSFSIRGK